MKYILLIFLFLSDYTFSQKIAGIVKDETTKEIIPYVSIGIIGENYGAYSTNKGEFQLTIKDYTTKDTLKFSCIGYEDKVYNVVELIDKELETTFLNVELTPKNYQISEIYVYNSKNKKIKLGNKRSGERILLGIFDDKELGVVFENSKNLSLKDVSFKLSTSWGNPPDSAIFRFNIYSLENGLPKENILLKPIFFYLKKEDFNGYSTFDIREYNIIVNHDFAATFELVKQYGGNRIYFTGQLTGNKSIHRKGQQGYWSETYYDYSVKLKQSLIINALLEN